MISVRRLGLPAGPLAGAGVLLVAPAVYETVTGELVPFTTAGRATLALMAWMAVWWLTEAIHISVTALLPLVVLPLVTTGAGDPALSSSAAMKAAAAPYANPFIALFLGGFLVALAMERWGLHRRIALLALRCVGTAPASMIAGFMAISAVMSMWVSNTATAVMLLPIALSVVRLTESSADPEAGPDNVSRCLLLGVAYAASIGGIGTLIGTPPNLLLAGFMREQFGVEISFARWLLVGVPVVAIFVPLTWFLLTRVLLPVPRTPIAGGRQALDAARRELGPTSRAEWIVFIVFMTMAWSWILRPMLVGWHIGETAPLAGLTDAGIAMIAAMALFVLPAGGGRRVLDWDTARKAPWGILILFGGGLSLADAVSAHGVAEYLAAHAAALAGWPLLLVIVAVAAGVIFLTELTSNTATTATLLPVLAAVAAALGIEPIVLLSTAAIAASCAFMMPVATPPNAVVFASGHLRIADMCRAGFWLNLIGIGLVSALAYGVVGWALA